MKIVLKLLQYLVGLALVVAGAYVMALALALGLSKAKVDVQKVAPADFAQLLRTGAENADPLGLAAGAGLAVLGLLVARPAFSIGLGGRSRKEREKSLDVLVQDLGDADSRVRLAGAQALTEAAEPSTIPALIRSLRDSVSKVRGQAAEALEHMTGLTLDFMDVAPKAVREESVRRWQDWWESNKAAILAGADPRSLGAADDVEPIDDEALLPPEEPLPAPTPRPGSVRAVERTTPPPGSVGAVDRTTPRPGAVGTVDRTTTPPGSLAAADRRKRSKSAVISLKEAVRRKHMRQSAGGATHVRVAPPPPESPAPPQPAPPADSGEEPEGDLPPPDEGLPPPQ